MVQLLAYYKGKSWDTFLNTFPIHEFEDKMNCPLSQRYDKAKILNCWKRLRAAKTTTQPVKVNVNV